MGDTARLVIQIEDGGISGSGGAGGGGMGGPGGGKGTGGDAPWWPQGDGAGKGGKDKNMGPMAPWDLSSGNWLDRYEQRIAAIKDFLKTGFKSQPFLQGLDVKAELASAASQAREKDYRSGLGGETNAEVEKVLSAKRASEA